MKRLFLTAILIGLIAVAAVLIYRDDNTTNSDDTYKIGVILPITGVGASYGENQRNAILLAVKQINEGGGVNGKKLEVIIENDNTDPKTTVTSAQKLINTDDVKVIIGGVWNHLAEAVIPVIDKSKILLISPTVPADSLSSKSPYVFFTFPTIASNDAVFDRFLSKYRNSKIAIMIWNNTWGIAHADEFKKAIERTGNNLIREVVMPLPDNNDVRGELTVLKALNPDVIFTALNFGDARTFAKAKREFDIKAVALNHYNLASAYLNGLINKDDMEGYYFFRPALPTRDFLEKYRKEYGNEPDIPDADSAYDAVYIIKLALENNGGKYTTDDMISGLRKIRDYEGASGIIDLTVNNWPENKTPYLEVFEDGEFVRVQ